MDAPPFDAGSSGRIGVVPVDEPRASSVHRRRPRGETSRTRQPPSHRGQKAGCSASKKSPEEDDRAAHAVQRQAVLRAVGEDLLFGSRATGRVHDARARDREEAVFSDAVREVLRDVRGETCGRLVDVHPRGNAETFAAVRPSPSDFERGLHVRVGVGRGIGRRRERAERVVERGIGCGRHPCAEVGGFHHSRTATGGDRVSRAGQGAAESRDRSRCRCRDERAHPSRRRRRRSRRAPPRRSSRRAGRTTAPAHWSTIR